MSEAPHTTSPTSSQAQDDQDHWQIKPLGWRLIFTDRLLWLAVGLSFAAHLVLLSPQYGIRIPQRGDSSLIVSFRAANQPMARSAASQPATDRTEQARRERSTRAIKPVTSSSTAAPRLAPATATKAPAAMPSTQAGSATPAGATGNRRVTLTPGMKDYRYSQYLEDWRRKVERIGAMNYPEEARGKFFGSLVLSVALRPDGSVDRILVTRSSGNPVLDEAAKRIVTFAAPFAPFPPDIRQETDYLDITRTWTFTRGSTLETR